MLKKMLTKEIQGTGGDDKIVGTDENDVIRAGAGNDEVDGRGGYDEIDGGDGNDILVGELLDGGDGDDILYGVSMNGGRGIDTLVGSNASDSLDMRFDPSEAPSADLLHGGRGDDVYGIDHSGDIVFEAAETGNVISQGRDTAFVRIQNGGWYAHDNVEKIFAASDTLTFLVGNAGDNEIRGGAAGELLLGGDGRDEISGGGDQGTGNDLIFGEGGHDSLFGKDGIDYIVGGTGSDFIIGGDDADALYGEDGDDELQGGFDFATDIMVGGAGNDVLEGQSGLGDYDLMDGGSGNDAYLVDTPADLTFEAAGGGTDSVYANIEGAGYYLYAHVENLHLFGNTSFGVGNELDNFLSARGSSSEIVVSLLGGAGKDRIWGSDGANGIYGEDGNDSLAGYGGNDVIDGGAGNDLLDGGEGNDIMVGGTGIDWFYVKASGERSIDYVLDFEDGVDQIKIEGYTDFAALQPHIAQQGADAVIEYATGQFLVIQNLNIASLSGADFVI